MKDVLEFWFNAKNQPFWFQKSPEFDQSIHNQFSTLHQQAKQAELWQWRETIHGRLAEIIVLDQFSRNLFREQPQAFAQDPMALTLAQEAITLGLDQLLSPSERTFLYMPFMHSESLKIHQQAVALFQNLGIKSSLDYEYRHKAIIETFGRYPHRNAALNRSSTSEEIAFLKQPNSHF